MVFTFRDSAGLAAIAMIDPIYMAEPPAGQVRNYFNPPTAHKELTATGVSTTIIAAVVVAVRLFTRLSVTKNGIQMDDCTYRMLWRCAVRSADIVLLDMILCALGLSIAMLGLSFERTSRKLYRQYTEVYSHIR